MADRPHGNGRGAGGDRPGDARDGHRAALAYNRPMTPDATGQPAMPAPARIHADRAAGTLEIDWRDGHLTVYDVVTLRWLCPCAYCRGEAGLPGWLDSAPELSADQTRLVDLQLVGQYAVAPTWGDGHHTGFYTFSLLRSMCPCPECTGLRTAEGRPTIGRPDHARHAGTDGPGHAPGGSR